MMTKHPSNHLERLKIKLRKDEKKQLAKASKAGHIRRRLAIESVKKKETEDELRKALLRNDDFEE